MSKRPTFAEIAQRALDVHVRYYAGLGQLEKENNKEEKKL